MTRVRTRVCCALVAALGVSGCGPAVNSPAPVPTTHPSGLQVTLHGPSVIEQDDTWNAWYEAHVENHGPKPIAFAVHPIWLKLEVLTKEGEKLEAVHPFDADWSPPTPLDLVIIRPGEKRIFNAWFLGDLEPGTYDYVGVLRPCPTEGREAFEEFTYAMREVDAVFLESECRSAAVTVRVE